MDCPTLEILGRALDLDPEDPEHLRVMAHVRLCADCRHQADVLGQVEAALGSPTAWGELGLPGCLHAKDTLEVLHDEMSVRDAHLAACPMCAAELEAIQAVEDEWETLAPAPVALRSRLKRLATITDDTTIEEWTARRRSTRTGRIGSGVSRRASRTSSGVGRRSGRTGSGVGRRPSGRHSSRRRSGSRRLSRRVAPPPTKLQQPTWAWGVLAAAAVVLVAFALVLTPGPKSDVAKATPQPKPSKTTVKVSDLAKQPRKTDGRTSTDVDAQYPLPDVKLPPRKVTGDDPVEPLPPEDGPGTPSDLETPSAQPTTRVRPKATVEQPKPAKKTTTTEQPAISLAARRGPITDDGGRLQLALNRLNTPLQLQTGDASWKKLGRARGALPLKPGDRIRSARGGLLSLDEGAYEIALGRDTEVVIRAAKRGPVLDLVRGQILCEVASLEASRRFQVGTEQAEFAVLGTIFAVAASERVSAVRVVEGTVKAKNAHGSTQVPAGRGVDLDGRRAPPAPTTFKPGELAWAKPFRPQRKLLFSATFDDRKVKGFKKGTLTRDHDPRGGLALTIPQHETQQHWGYAAMISAGRLPTFRPGPDVYIQFSIWTDKPADVLLQAYNDKQKREFQRPFSHPGGYWRTFTVNSMELSTYFDPGRNPVKLGDLFTDLEIYAGKPKVTRTFLLDDVQIYRRVYR